MGEEVDVLLQYNEVFNAVTSNRDGQIDRQNDGSGREPAVLSWRFDEPVRRSERWTVEGNHFHDNWGDCFDALYLSDSVVRGNHMHDCYSVNLYLDDASHVQVDGNRLYVSTDRYNRGGTGEPAHGIVFANENSEIDCTTSAAGQRCPLDALSFTNNLITGVADGILYYHVEGGYSNLLIAHNVIYGPRNESVYFGATSQAGSVSVVNNVLYAGSDSAVVAADTCSITLRCCIRKVVTMVRIRSEEATA